MSEEIRRAAMKFDEVHAELEKILRPYIEDVVVGKAPAPPGMELKKVEERFEGNDRETLFSMSHEGRPVAYIFKGASYTTLILAGITALTLRGFLIPAYEEWRCNLTADRKRISRRSRRD